MRFKLYREHGALNSPPVFNAFEQGVLSHGHKIVNSNEDIAVIWSVLWAGRMSANREIYNRCQLNNTKVIIIEVGNLIRDYTWRISLNHINALGQFGNIDNLDYARPSKLKIKLSPAQVSRKPEILIAGQHQQSLQWEGQPRMAEWISNTVTEIRKYSNRSIIVRAHPRSKIVEHIPDVQLEVAKKIQGTYDAFDINYGYHCVINYNSGPAVQAAIQGVPIICNSSSLAYPVSADMSTIENIVLPDRTDWFLKLCHTEWSVEEIANGIPLSRLPIDI